MPRLDTLDCGPDHLGPAALQANPLLARERARAADELHAGDRADVVAEQGPALLLLALAIEHPFHAREVAVEVPLERVLEPLPLLLGLERTPLLLVLVKVLENLVKDTAPLHRHRDGHST